MMYLCVLPGERELQCVARYGVKGVVSVHAAGGEGVAWGVVLPGERE